jgi:hypothetical protein
MERNRARQVDDAGGEHSGCGDPRQLIVREDPQDLGFGLDAFLGSAEFEDDVVTTSAGEEREPLPTDLSRLHSREYRQAGQILLQHVDERIGLTGRPRPCRGR